MTQIPQKQFHFGVYGVIESNNQILVVRKARGPYKALLDVPGGKPEHGESLKETLKREINEETGLIIEKFSFSKEFSFLTRYFTSENIHIELHHIGLLYSIDSADFSAYNPSISFEDIEGSSWINKDFILKDMCSPILAEVLNL